MIAKEDLDALHNVYQKLYDSLNNAYWAASTIEAKDRIHGISEIVFEVLTAINEKDISSDTAEYEEIKKNILALNGNMEQLKNDIDNLVHSVKIATDVANYIDKAIGFASKFLI